MNNERDRVIFSMTAASRFLLAGLMMLVCAVSPARARFDPSFAWRTLETEHFLVHFHQDGEATARKAAAIAEDVHGRLVPYMEWEPAGKTHLVLVDAMDDANGFASPFPYNRIVVYLTWPVGATGLGAVRFDDWLRLVITHEYAHVLQLDMTDGGLGWLLQAVFGRLYFPNLFQPLWLIEGLATFEETEQTDGGRGRSPSTDMVLRMQTLDGIFPTLDRMAVFPDTWPSADVPYLFGESFIRFLAEQHGRHGREAVAEISKTYSRRWFPFLVNSTGRLALGDDYGKLWRKWKTGLELKYEQQAAEVRGKGLTPSVKLTGHGYVTVAPVVSPDGTRIAYSAADNDEFPAIYVMNRDGSGGRRVVENAFSFSADGAGPAWSRDGRRLYFSHLEFRGENLYSEIRAVDPDSGKEEPFTCGLRGRSPSLSASGDQLLFVANRNGRNRLVVADIPQDHEGCIDEGSVRYLTQEDDLQFESPRFNHDGTLIAAGVLRPGAGKDIWLFDANGVKRAEITNDRAVDGEPAWGPDGRYLFFSSDRTGIFNIFAYELGTGALFQVTNVLGGAFSPALAPDGRTLVFSSYSARGYDIHSMELDPSSWRPAEGSADAPLETAVSGPEAGGEARPYSPLPSLLPRFWLPWYGYSKTSGSLYGAYTSGMDAVERHQYVLTGLYGPKTSRIWYTADYFYDGLLPMFHLTASDLDNSYDELFVSPLFAEDYVEREKTYGLSVILPYRKVKHQHYLIAGFRWRELSRLSPIPVWYTGRPPGEGVLASGSIMYYLNTARTYAFSISPENGRTLQAGYEQFSHALGSDYHIHKATGDWHEFVDLPWQHAVLSLRGFGGFAKGPDARQLPQRFFQLGGENLLENPQDALIGLESQDVALRGYPVNAFRGRKAMLASAEVRVPLWNVERGPGSLPFFLRRVHAAFFVEAGNAWEATFTNNDLKRGVGAELRFDTYLAYSVPVTLRVGIAHGLDEKGETYPTLGIWIPVLF